MSRKFIATIVAASIALTSISAVPAQAGDRDFARFLAGAVGLAIIGAAISERNKNKASRHDTYEEPRRVKPRDLPHRISRKSLPRRCLRTANKGDRVVKMFGRRCLERNYRYSRALPEQCERRYRNSRGDRRFGFGARCLHKHGYRLQRG